MLLAPETKNSTQKGPWRSLAGTRVHTSEILPVKMDSQTGDPQGIRLIRG